MSWAEIGDALNSTKKNPNLFKPLDEWLKYRGGDIVYEYENAGTFSLTVPEWATIAIVTACGGGGGGDYMTYNSSIEDYVAGNGGAGGCAICNNIYTVTGGARLSITVGKGGTGGTRLSSTTAPTNGGSTVIGSLVTLAGGAAKSTSSSGAGSGGAGKVGLTGGVYASNSYCGGGSLGNGGCMNSSGGVYLSPTRGGGGGAAMYHSGNGYDAGQDGADGYVRIVFK